MTITLRNVPRDRRVERAFTKSLAKTPVAWNCERGMHRPVFLVTVWACASCSVMLNTRQRTYGF